METSQHRKNKKDKMLHVKSTNRHSRRIALIISIIAGVIILASGFYYFQNYIGDAKQPVLTVDGDSISKDYFLKRIKMSDLEPAVILDQLVYEQIVKKAAPQYEIEVSQSETDKALRNQASTDKSSPVGNAGTTKTLEISNEDFQEWYRQQLETTGLSDKEYRDVIHLNLLATGLRNHLSKNIPNTAEQIHLYVMALATYEDAIEAITRIAAGEKFADVSGEVSVESMSKERSGDLGWIPRGVIPYDNVVFQLKTGQISQPVMIDSQNPDTSQYAVFLVTEKDSNRVIEPHLMQLISYREFYKWLEEERQKHSIENNFDLETQAWVEDQLLQTSKN